MPSAWPSVQVGSTVGAGGRAARGPAAPLGIPASHEVEIALRITSLLNECLTCFLGAVKQNGGMTTPRRIGAENSETRRRLLDITERLMLEEGYAAVGVRRVAREADVAPALVLYYFRTLDELFLAVMRRRAEGEGARQAQALEADRPLRALWETSNDPGVALITEFLALANHRKAIAAEIVAHAEMYRKAQIESLVRAAAEDPARVPDVAPEALVVLTTAVSRVLVMEEAMGLTYGHAEALAFVEEMLRKFDSPSSPA
jgi:AcrR family transcriptional regulator